MKFLKITCCIFLFITLSAWKIDPSLKKEITATLRNQILTEAKWAMQQKPITVTADHSARSTGGKNDFYSEGDYWWPDTKNPEGPYVQRDGLTNPDNFVAHRLAMIRFSEIVGTLASAFKITGDEKYAAQALLHLKALFVNSNTLINPNLQYAQAIKGITTGRGIGIIDTIHLMEVAQGVLVFEKSKVFDKETMKAIRNWFSSYLEWLTTSKNGLQEKAAKNNHGTCWVMQVASFAKLVGNEALLDSCAERYKTVLLPNQMAEDGGFPLELARTKPYGYSIFNLDAMATICQIISTPDRNLWAFETVDGRSIKKGIEYLYPFVVNKNKWPIKPDVMYWNEWPVAQPFLLFGANAYRNGEWLATWEGLEHQPGVEEVVRNLPIRNPLIWM